jgi:hypothetical protein
MVKYFLLLLTIVVGLEAGIVDKKVQQLLDKETYTKHNKLIKRLFRKESRFLVNKNSVDFEKILKVLKKNGLLTLFFTSRENFYITFNTTTKDHLFFMKVILNSLSKVGYDFVLTDYIKRDLDKISWRLQFNSEYTIDPLIFIKELHKSGCAVSDLKLQNIGSWEYKLDVSRSFLGNIKQVSKTKNIFLKDSKRNYMLKIKNGTKIVIKSHTINNWYPNIVFFDSKLNILDTVFEDRIVDRISLNIPPNTKYVKIGDIYTKKNISRGLKVYVK